MQAITIAISPAGLNYFAVSKLQKDLAAVLAPIAPPDDNIYVGTVYSGRSTCSDTDIKLTQGSVTNYAPVLLNGGISQGTIALGTSGQFTADMSAPNFSVNYQWEESYTAAGCSGGLHPTCWNNPIDSTWPYSTPAKLDVSVTFAIVFDASTQVWSLPVLNSNTVANVTPNAPPDSIVQGDGSCYENAAATAVDKAFGDINFSTQISTLMPKVLATIPASGQLTPNILFGFAIGDAGIAFPNDAGIALGVTGTVSWKGTTYPGPTPAPLGVPPVPSDHHLQIYLSDYSINALYWAFYNDGQLAVTLLPDDIGDPNALRVKTYVSACPALAPYATKDMSALIEPLAAPTVLFQTVYILSAPVMTNLQAVLPTDVYTNLANAMGGNAYPNQAAIEADFATYGIPQQYFSTIEQQAQLKGAAVTHQLRFKLTILEEPDPAPYIEFSVQRTDALSSFTLGPLANKNPVQTMQFKFNECSSSATFIGSNIPDLGTQFPDVWDTVGDEEYDQVLQATGAQGVPLPIMQDFKFLFDQAVLNVEQDFISILANVQFTG